MLPLCNTNPLRSLQECEILDIIMKLCCKLKSAQKPKHMRENTLACPTRLLISVRYECSRLTLFFVLLSFFPPASTCFFAACCGKVAFHLKQTHSLTHNFSVPLWHCSCGLVFCVSRVQVCSSGPGLHCGQLGEYRHHQLCSCERLYHHSHW